MPSFAIVGLALVVLGFLMLYLLKGTLVHLITLIAGVIGIVVALLLIVIGLGLIFGGQWARGRWKRYATVKA